MTERIEEIRENHEAEFGKPYNVSEEIVVTCFLFLRKI